MPELSNIENEVDDNNKVSINEAEAFENSEESISLVLFLSIDIWKVSSDILRTNEIGGIRWFI